MDNEFTLKLPNAKTFDLLDSFIDSYPDPGVKGLAFIVRDLADAIIVLSKVIAASNKRVTITNANREAGE